jgi:dipeptidyl aminopeptidase/acylaminoacyl peptidase
MSSLVFAQTPAQKPLVLADYLDWENVGEPQLSPDGSQVIYTRSWVNKLKDSWDSALWIMNADGTRNRFLTKGSSPLWSPDGTRIAYLTEGEPSGTQIFVRYMDAEGATTQVTRVSETPGSLHWSPDGKNLAFAMLVEKKGSWDLDLPKAPKGATWTEAPRVIEGTHFRQDRNGFMREGFTHLFLVPAEGGTPRALTEGEWNVGARPMGLDFGVGLDWTPDGSEIVFDGLNEKDADARYRESHIYAVNVATGKLRQITKAKGPWGSPVVSPDGHTIAYTGYPWTDQTYKAEEIWVMGLDGQNPRKISGDLDRDPGELFWASDGGGLYFTAEDRGQSNVYFASFSGVPKRITEGSHFLTLSCVSRKGMAVGARTSPQQPADVVRVDLAKGNEIVQLTHVNDDVLGGKALAEVEEAWAPSTGNTQVQGFLVKPPGFDPKRKYPLILHIHGGPHAMYNVAFNFSFQHLATAGYLVLYTNPRGSTGYGTDFGNAIDNAYPSVDYDDLMASVDAVMKRGCVDQDRLYATGVSGGGVLSSWIVGHTDRFAAAAVRAPVIDWISFAGTTDLARWGYNRFHRPFWEDPKLWLEHSPIMYVQNVKTPVLLMTGELDLRTPMGQTEEFYQALKARGVPTAMVRFNGEYHGTASKPSNFMRTQLYLLKWFERYHRGAGPPNASAGQ